MAIRTPDAISRFNPIRILGPVLLSLALVGYLLYDELIKSGLGWTELAEQLVWGPRAIAYGGLALLMVGVREFGYIWQLRLLTERRISWGACFQVVVLWNFFASLSPSIVGGTAVAVFLLLKEGISIGRTTTIVFTTIFFDQFFYTTIPLSVSFLVPQDDIFAPLDLIRSEAVGAGMVTAFWSAWLALLLYVLFLIAALFVAPGWIHWWLTKLLALRWMARWRHQGKHLTEDLHRASRDLTKRPLRFWLAVWFATSLAWFGRYWILNAVLGAFSPTAMGFYDFVLASARQAVLWVLMVISPTPGSSGIAELGFSWLFGDLVPKGTALQLAILWRLLAYYPYLIIGVPVMSRWIKRVYGRDD